MTITAPQVRMARAGLMIGVRELAKLAELTPATVTRIEHGKDALGSTLQRLRESLEKLGAEFTDDGWVRVQRPAVLPQQDSEDAPAPRSKRRRRPDLAGKLARKARR